MLVCAHLHVYFRPMRQRVSMVDELILKHKGIVCTTLVLVCVLVCVCLCAYAFVRMLFVLQFVRRKCVVLVSVRAFVHFD